MLMTLPKLTSARKPDDVQAAVLLLANLLAELLADKLRTPTESDDDLIDRATCPYSKRWWDAHVGRAFEARRDGRKFVARRGDVEAAWRRQAKTVTKAPKTAPSDSETAELEAAGIHLNGGAQ
jgi:hypothetical protein